MELNKYYSLEEVSDIKVVTKMLGKHSKNSKILFSINSEEILTITDLDLSEKEITNLIKFFDSNDVIPYIEYEGEEDEEEFYNRDSYYDDDEYDEYE